MTFSDFAEPLEHVQTFQCSGHSDIANSYNVYNMSMSTRIFMESCWVLHFQFSRQNDSDNCHFMLPDTKKKKKKK